MVKIRAKGRRVEGDGAGREGPRVNGELPCWADVEVEVDGKVLTGVKSVRMNWSDSDEPLEALTATLEVYVEELEVEVTAERKSRCAWSDCDIVSELADMIETARGRSEVVEPPRLVLKPKTLGGKYPCAWSDCHRELDIAELTETARGLWVCQKCRGRAER